jgi:acyl homoserine lactone synthase
VPRSETLLEIDDYDRHTSFIGVFDRAGSLVAFMRLTLPGTPYMIEKEFSSLIGPWHALRRERDTTEASRSCVAAEARKLFVRGSFGPHRLSMLVYKGVYHWCRRNGVRYVYIVIEEKLYRMLRAKGFESHLTGAPVTMPDGCVIMGAVIDWTEFVALNLVKRPDFAKWFTLYGSDRVEEPRLRPDFYSPPQVSP